jgi:hypothetical protein
MFNVSFITIVVLVIFLLSSSIRVLRELNAG